LRIQGQAEWGATADYDNHAEERWFDEVDEALAWANERAAMVLVRLGSSEVHHLLRGSKSGA